MSDPLVPAIPVNLPFELRPAADAAQTRARAGELAQEFEAMLMLQMIRQMRQSMLDESEEERGLGGSTMRDTFDVEFSRHLAQAGGIGLGRFLAEQLDARETAEPGAAPGAGASATALSANRHLDGNPGRSPDTGGAPETFRVPDLGSTTSPFGWRRDPISGGARFHAGVDLRAAYGTAVPAAADGEVVFAGARGSYGNLVIVRHESGIESRYAHLSTVDVREGETVAIGQSVGRVGSTGRSTAPHLHFEVLVNGARVDPATLAGRIGRGPLKSGDPADD